MIRLYNLLLLEWKRNLGLKICDSISAFGINKYKTSYFESIILASSLQFQYHFACVCILWFPVFLAISRCPFPIKFLFGSSLQMFGFFYINIARTHNLPILFFPPFLLCLILFYFLRARSRSLVSHTWVKLLYFSL